MRRMRLDSHIKVGKIRFSLFIMQLRRKKGGREEYLNAKVRRGKRRETQRNMEEEGGRGLLLFVPNY
jgi:hypothetical protein